MAWLPVLRASVGRWHADRSQWRDRPGVTPEFLGSRSPAILSQACGRLYGVPSHIVTVVGIGADGWPGLSPLSKAAIERAEVLAGSPRQLVLVPSHVAGRRVPLPVPLLRGLPGLIEEHAPTGLV